MIKLGMHTDNWRVLSGGFETAIEKIAACGLSHVEYSVIYGLYYIQSMGYDPSVSLLSNGRAVRRYLEEHGLETSQIDASFPMMGPEGTTHGVQYVQQAIRFAAELGCPMVDTSDCAHQQHDLSEEEVFRITCDNYRHCLPWAEDYGVIINVEPHGPYTNNGDFMERLLSYFESEYLQFNMDTGNNFISGQDPLEFLKRFRKVLKHVHSKDVSESLAAAARGEDTGIGSSEVAVGGGVNAGNIAKCIEYLRETDWDGVATIECYGSDENIASSMKFMRNLVGDA